MFKFLLCILCLHLCLCSIIKNFEYVNLYLKFLKIISLTTILHECKTVNPLNNL